MRSVRKGRLFRPINDDVWTSVKKDRPHKFRLNNVEYTFDGYNFYINDIGVNYIGGKKRFSTNYTFRLISAITQPSGVKNYMGYCDEENFYMLYDEEQIEFI